MTAKGLDNQAFCLSDGIQLKAPKQQKPRKQPQCGYRRFLNRVGFDQQFIGDQIYQCSGAKLQNGSDDGRRCIFQKVITEEHRREHHQTQNTRQQNHAFALHGFRHQ